MDSAAICSRCGYPRTRTACARCLHVELPHMPSGTLPARRLDTWDATVHGALYRNEWGPKQEGEAGHWWVVSPVLDTARLGPEFTVTEHGDGTISVYPSLVFERPGQSGFHGYLNRSVWSWGEFEDRRYRDAA